MNAEISTVRLSDMPDLEYVCNPFSGPPDYLYEPDDCSSSTIKIGDIPQVPILTSLYTILISNLWEIVRKLSITWKNETN